MSAPRHWSEPPDGEDGDEGGPSMLQLEAAEVKARASACAKLRALLADGRWHDVAIELVDHPEVRGTASVLVPSSPPEANSTSAAFSTSSRRSSAVLRLAMRPMLVTTHNLCQG